MEIKECNPMKKLDDQFQVFYPKEKADIPENIDLRNFNRAVEDALEKGSNIQDVITKVYEHAPNIHSSWLERIRDNLKTITVTYVDKAERDEIVKQLDSDFEPLIVASQNEEVGEVFLKEAFKIGDTAEDGWIFAGISKDPKSPGYKNPLWVAPEDTAIVTHDGAKEIVKACRKKGNPVRLATLIELSQMFNFLAKKGKGEFSQGSYWAKEYKRYSFVTANKNSSDDKQKVCDQENLALVRLVR